MSANEVTNNLKGKIITKPQVLKWHVVQNPEVETSVVIKELKTEDTYAYTYETPAEWTPYNSNLQMHGMKVYVKDPVPDHYHSLYDNAFFILDMVREERQRQIREKEKAEKITKETRETWL